MKLLNHCDDFNFVSSSSSVDVDRELQSSSEEVKLYEDKFFKIFYLNPCPMTIADIKTGKIIDVNNAFIEAVELRNKNQIINKSTVELNIIKETDRKYIFDYIYKKGNIKNYCCEFNTVNGKKKMGMFSGSLIELSDITCLMLICQIVNKKFLTGIFKTFLAL